MTGTWQFFCLSSEGSVFRFALHPCQVAFCELGVDSMSFVFIVLEVLAPIILPSQRRFPVNGKGRLNLSAVWGWLARSLHSNHGWASTRDLLSCCLLQRTEAALPLWGRQTQCRSAVESSKLTGWSWRKLAGTKTQGRSECRAVIAVLALSSPPLFLQLSFNGSSLPSHL